MSSMRITIRNIGYVILGFAAGVVNYFLTSYYFFSHDQGFLGLVQLLIPPAEFVLPWVADPKLGVLSISSLALILLGGSVASVADPSAFEN